MKKMLVLVVVLGLFSLAGCGGSDSTSNGSQMTMAEANAMVTIGMTRTQVRAALGQPDGSGPTANSLGSNVGYGDWWMYGNDRLEVYYTADSDSATVTQIGAISDYY